MVSNCFINIYDFIKFLILGCIGCYKLFMIRCGSIFKICILIFSYKNVVLDILI